MKPLPLSRPLIGGDSLTRRLAASVVAWSIADLSPFAWYRAESIAQADGSAVATWADQSGNGRDLTQGTAGLQPTLAAGVLNGRAVVRFDGVDDVLTAAVPARPAQTVAIILRRRTSSSATACPLSFTGDVRAALAAVGSPTTWYWLHGEGLTNEPLNLSATAWAIIVIQGTAAAATIYAGATLVASFDPADNLATGAQIVLGELTTQADGPRPCDADIAELVIIDRVLSDADRLNLTNKLAADYGL